jgi:2-C-methyl-D-erythritol 4-phosphate cytidylyltransferase
MVEWSIAAFRAAETVRSIVVACPPGHVHDLDRSDLMVVDGGETRAHSVSNALEAVETPMVAIHDAARPLVTAELIEALAARLAEASDVAGVIAATQVTDTIKQAVAGTRAAFPSYEIGNAALVIEQTLDRKRLWAAQTPQVFRTGALRAALAGDPERVAAATDEAMLVEAAGGTVLIHQPEGENFKVTTPLDLRVAELLLSERGAD